MWEGTRTAQQDPTVDGIQARGDGRARGTDEGKCRVTSGRARVSSTLVEAGHGEVSTGYLVQGTEAIHGKRWLQGKAKKLLSNNQKGSSCVLEANLAGSSLARGSARCRKKEALTVVYR